MAVPAPAPTTQTTSSATTLPPSSSTTSPTTPSHATLNQQIDSLLHHIELNTHRLALEAAYDPSIPFHPGCKDCVRDYVRHVRGAQPLKAAVEAAREGERVKREWEKMEEEGGVLREMREGRREEVGRWERLVRGKREGKKREEMSRLKLAVVEPKAEAEGKPQSAQREAGSTSASLAKAAKAMWGGRLARQGGEDALPPASTAASPRDAEPASRAPTSPGFGLDPLSTNIDTHGQDSRHDIEQAQQAFHNLDLDQQLALLLNAGQSS